MVFGRLTDAPGAAAEPAQDAFTPDLATALNNQSNRLAELGRPEDALAAIEERLGIHARWRIRYVAASIGSAQAAWGAVGRVGLAWRGGSQQDRAATASRSSR
jgi:hypothetical protein